jgi:hypothetical protein
MEEVRQIIPFDDRGPKVVAEGLHLRVQTLDLSSRSVGAMVSCPVELIVIC